jgi:hypothetical protein
MEINSTSLEIRILLKCGEGLLNKRYITNLYKKYPKADRDESIKTLIDKKYIIAQEMPKLWANKTPIFTKLPHMKN